MRRGLSLLEVVFAVAVLTLFFFTLVSLFPSMLVSMRKTEHRLQANSYAQEILDRCSAGPFSDLAATGVFSVTAGGALAPVLVRRKLEDDVLLEPEVEIAVGPTANTANNLRLVTVRVRWQEQNRTQLAVRHRRIAKVQR